MIEEFVVSADKRVAVLDNLSRIQAVYGVDVQFSEADAEAEGSAAGDSGCILPADGTTTTPAVWVQVDGEQEKCLKAKEYLLSLCSENRIEEIYSPAILAMLDARIPQLEYESGAVIQVDYSGGNKLIIQGANVNIGRAQSLIAVETASTPTDADYYNPSRNVECEYGAIGQGTLRTITAIPRSDFSDSGNISSKEEVDGKPRAVIADDGTPSQRELQGKALPSSSSKTQSKHEEIVALMQKLGYDRPNVELVLRQIGEQASSNEVLQMLVSQGSTQLDEEEEEESISPENGGVPSPRDVSDGVSDGEDKGHDPYRPVIIDGSNVAMSYGNKNVFACKGIDTVVMWFLKRGHGVIYVFVPSWRKEQSKPETPIQNQEVLMQLEAAKILVWTPSRRVKGRRLVCYDDRYILNLALELDGIVVSNDTFRDLCAEKPEYRKVVEERLLMYSFAGDKFMPPDDPLGRHGPSLDNFLRKTPSKPSHHMQQCPYGKKCTYGSKCKYSHPERTKNLKPTSEILQEKDRLRKEEKIKQHLQARALAGQTIGISLEHGDDACAGSSTEPLEGKSRFGFGHPLMATSAATVPLMATSAATVPLMATSAATVPLMATSAATVPLMNHSMSNHGMKTVPLTGPQHSHVPHTPSHEDALSYRNTSAFRTSGSMPAQKMLPIGESWQGIPGQRVGTRPLHHPHQNKLPDRSMMTAPITGYTPLARQQQSREMMTVPLTATEHYQHQIAAHGKRHSFPAGVPERQLPASGSGLTIHSTPYSREGSTIRDYNQGMQQLSLHDRSSNHGIGLDEERHYSYPLHNHVHPLHLMRQNSTSDFIDQIPLTSGLADEGYFSPQPQSFHHPTNHGSFNYPSATSDTRWGQHSRTGNPAMQPGSRVPDLRMGHQLVGPRWPSEQAVQRSAWNEVSADPSGLARSVEELTRPPQMMRRGSSGQQAP